MMTTKIAAKIAAKMAGKLDSAKEGYLQDKFNSVGIFYDSGTSREDLISGFSLLAGEGL